MARFILFGQRLPLWHVGPVVAVAVWLALAAMSTSLRADPSDQPQGPPREREQGWDDRDGPRGPDARRHDAPRGPEADGPRRPRGMEDRPMPSGPPRDREQGWDGREPPRGPDARRRELPRGPEADGPRRPRGAEDRPMPGGPPRDRQSGWDRGPGAWRHDGPPPGREQLERLEAKLDDALRCLHRLEAELRHRSGPEDEFGPPRFDGRQSRPRPPRPPHDGDGISSDHSAPPPAGPRAMPPRHERRGPDGDDRPGRDGPRPRPPRDPDEWDK